MAITGATSGIGTASARAMASEGASVVFGGRRRERLDGLMAEIGGIAVEMDARDPAASQHLFETAAREFGQLDALVANAGIGAYGGIMDLSDQQLQ